MEGRLACLSKRRLEVLGKPALVGWVPAFCVSVAGGNSRSRLCRRRERRPCATSSGNSLNGGRYLSSLEAFLNKLLLTL